MNCIAFPGYKYMNHGGSTYGHYSYITFIPDLGIGVFSVISGDDYMLTDTFKMQKLMQMSVPRNFNNLTSKIASIRGVSL